MKFKKLLFVSVAISSAAFLASCSGDDIVQNGQGNNNGNSPAGVVFEGENSTPEHNNPGTRTTATHVIGQGAKVFWEATDEIWVKDDAGTFQKSTGTTLSDPADKSKAVFALGTGSFTGTTHQVVYTGKGSTSATEVEIKANQTQTATNSFAHLGESGDCGVATATQKPTGGYKFALEHKAAYLAIYPRIQGDNILRGNVRLDKIVITSTDAIAGKYSFSATTGLSSAPIANSSNSITLTTTSGELSLTTDANICYYAVIAPGNHALTAEYYITDPTTNVSTTVKKDLGTIPCDEGKITDVSAWVNRDIPAMPIAMEAAFNPKYYMWGATHDYWYGVVPSDYSSSTIPQASNPDGRWYDQTAGLGVEASSSSFDGMGNIIPNAIELAYYVKYGDPHYVVYSNTVFVRSDHHLVKGINGLYLRKKSTILDYLHSIGFSASFSVNDMKTRFYESVSAYNSGTYRDKNNILSFFTIPSVGIPANVNDYFFLPALGYYYNGVQYSFGTEGYYWASTSQWFRNSDAFFLYFLHAGGAVYFYSNKRIAGYSARAFE